MISPRKGIKKYFNHNLLIWLLLLLPYILLVYGYFYHMKQINKISESKIVIVDKGALSLTVLSYSGKIILEFPISVGKNFGDKKEIGDLKTPQGIFKILTIEDSSEWEYDFEDDTLGAITGAYGPWFLRLDANGFKGIGIHGTYNENSIRKRTTHGCIRLKNDDLRKLKEVIVPGTLVIVLPSEMDVLSELN